MFFHYRLYGFERFQGVFMLNDATKQCFQIVLESQHSFKPFIRRVGFLAFDPETSLLLGIFNICSHCERKGNSQSDYLWMRQAEALKNLRKYDKREHCSPTSNARHAINLSSAFLFNVDHMTKPRERNELFSESWGPQHR